MRGRVPSVGDDALAALERAVQQALASDAAAIPEVLGYGEISCVLALRREGAAAKRLPPFPSPGAFDAYRLCFEAQLAAFAEHGIPVLASELRRVAGAGGRAYCLQPLVDSDALVPARLSRGETGWLERVLDLVVAYVAPDRGLDAQLSNWVVLDGDLAYLDVTTPLLRDEAGRERLDLDLFLASLPWVLRGPVKRFALHGILDAYYSPRGVVLDLLGNLVKEGLAARLPQLVPMAAERLGQPLRVGEVRRHYARDARTWRLLQGLRRLDRAWQRGVRRRPYPFLLPGPVQRNV